jgi:GrpB-like predicted nucleotidyltransferase (UPF0157 family)
MHGRTPDSSRRGAPATSDDPVAARRYHRRVDGSREDEKLERYLAEVTVGPLEHAPVVLREYDAAWPARFRAEAERIRAALGGRARRVEHIGSTSVPGLAAKPVVDILLVVDDPGDEASYLPALEAAGYELRVREPGFWQHHMLRTPARDVHVHVFPLDSPEIERYLLFRDRLRAVPAERELYEAAKRRLAAQDWPTVQHYAEAKTEVVEAVIARARASRAGDPASGGD